jgi:hypothetical protein
MRNALLAALIGVCPVLISPAGSSGLQKSAKPALTDKLLPLKETTANNPCAAYGPGFARVEGSQTCVHVGGYVRIDAGATAGR